MHDVMPTGIWPHNPLPPRQGNGHTRHALSIQSLARTWPSIGYHYSSCLHNAKLHRSFPASLCQQSRNASSHQPHHYWLAWGHQGSPLSPLPILATQRDSHHQGWSGPVRWGTCHSSCQVQQCQSTACLASTLSYTHWHQASISSRAVVPVLTQNNHSGQDLWQQPISHTSPWEDWHMLWSCQITGWQTQQNTCAIVCWSTSWNIWHPQKDLGFLLLWYVSYHGTAIKYAPHTAVHGDTFMNTVSKQSTLSQVAQLPHHRLQLDTASQWHNLHHPHLHSTCSPHPLHLQHQQLRWTRLQLFLPCQLSKRTPQHQCLWHPMPHLCSHEDQAVPAWHPDTWSRKSRNY